MVEDQNAVKIPMILILITTVFDFGDPARSFCTDTPQKQSRSECLLQLRSALQRTFAWRIIPGLGVTWFITMAIVSPLSRLTRVAPLPNGLLMAYKRGWSYLLTKGDDPPSGRPSVKGGWLRGAVFVSMGIPSYAPQKPLRKKAFIN